MPQHKFSLPATEFNGVCSVEAESETGIDALDRSGQCSVCVTPMEPEEPPIGPEEPPIEPEEPIGP